MDDVATNRMVLKTRLAAAHHEVRQAESGAAAVRRCRRDRPDLVLASASLPDMTSATLIAGIRGCGAPVPPPVILIAPRADATDRLQALRAGAADAVARSGDKGLLLARLRNLLRQRHADLDVAMQQDANPTLNLAAAAGLAEAGGNFRPAGRVTVVGDDAVAVSMLRRALARGSGHSFGTCAARDAIPAARDTDRDGRKPIPDLYVMSIQGARAEAGLSLLANLKSSRAGRRAPIIVLLEDGAHDLAPTVLDMGADDLLCAPYGIQELRLRIDAQLRRKHASDRMRAQLQSGIQAALIDPLTGLYNRRYALPWLTRMADSVSSGGSDLAVMIADIDHFKQVNDRFGHSTGDAALREVAARLRAVMRPGDLLARIGGEEFLIAAPRTDAVRARRLADALCARVRKGAMGIDPAAPALRLTISIGVTLAGPPTGRSGGNAVDALLAEADRALYEAKAAGRDTISFCARSAA